VLNFVTSYSRRLFVNLHLALGLSCSVFLLIMGVTGAFLAYEYSFDRLLNPKLFRVSPQGRRLLLSDLIRIVRQANPGAKVVLIDLAAVAGNRPDVSYSVQILRPVSTSQVNVFIDPYTGRILGERHGIGFAAQVHEFHFNLGMGNAGRMITAVLSGAMVVLALSGLVLWWPRKLLRINRNASAGRLNFELHNIVGFYCSLFVLLFGTTGVILYDAEVLTPALDRLATQPDQREPAVYSRPTPASTKTIGPDEVAVIAAGALPGARVSQVVLPKGLRGGYRVRLKFPEDFQTPGRSHVHVDQYTGEVLWSQSTRHTAPGTLYVKFWNREVHNGTAFGAPFQFAAAFTGLAVPLLAITGPLIWFRKQRRRSYDVSRKDDDNVIVSP